jgi:hypothetical protein
MRAAVLLVLPLIACGGPEAPKPWVPSQEPIVYYEAEDDPIDGADDSSGNGFTAVCDEGQCPVLDEGRIGAGWFFDGDDDRLRIPHHPDLDLTRGFTISMWFWLAGSDVGRALISRDLGEDPEDENTFIIMQTIWCSGRSDLLYYETAGNAPICGEKSIDIRGWTHVAATWDGSLKRFFIDGQVAANQGTVPIQFDEHDTIIGGNMYQGRFVSPFVGILDELRIYERALEPSEVLDLPGYQAD